MRGYLASIVLFGIAVSVLLLSPKPMSGQSVICGVKPIPNPGCRIGQCVDGSWEQICDTTRYTVCGVKPIPQAGCRIGQCVNGRWEEICDTTRYTVCGVKPIPRAGCRIGQCVDGSWEEICN